VSARGYLSIGDVLSLLRQEFPDVTISKIRFLESQGLVNPERSPSGYRKFYGSDVDRLRWVLRQQREHFLPLKVIRDRLAQWDEGSPPEDFAGASFAGPNGAANAQKADCLDAVEEHGDRPVPRVSEPATQPGPHHGLAPSFAGGPADASEALASGATAPALRGAPSAGSPQVFERPPGPPPSERGAREPATASALWAVETASGPGGSSEPVASSTGEPGPSSPPAASEAAGAGDEHGRRESLSPTSASEAQTGQQAGTPSTEVASGFSVAVGASGASLALEELCAASGLSATEVTALEGFGLIEPMVVAGSLYYDEEALTIARLVAEFSEYGIEPRHLRLYRNAVEREMGLVEQIVTPLLRQRNPQARKRAADAAANLARLGQGLRAALLRREIRRQLGN